MSETQMKSIVEAASQLVRDKYYNGKVVSNAIKNTTVYQRRLAEAIRDVYAIVNSIPTTV